MKLRGDQWSEGAARVATRLGLQGPSFDLAAEAYAEAVGSKISGDSVRRICEGWGGKVEERREQEIASSQVKVEAVPELICLQPTPPKQAEAEKGEEAALNNPERKLLQSQANISSDGTMMLVRKEGWKEVKLTVISLVEQVEPANDKAEETPTREKENRDERQHVRLIEHSYQAGLWDADTLGQQQAAEGHRRGLEECPKLSSVNDAAAWIERVTAKNYPEAVQIVDWGHAVSYLWKAGGAVWGERNRTTQAWVERQKAALWEGQVAQLLEELVRLELAEGKACEPVRKALVYFKNNGERMDYATYRAEGYPIGSGTAESAANTVVHHRMKRKGRGWERSYGQAMLAALSELHSGRFDQTWRQLAA